MYSARGSCHLAPCTRHGVRCSRLEGFLAALDSMSKNAQKDKSLGCVVHGPGSQTLNPELETLAEPQTSNQAARNLEHLATPVVPTLVIVIVDPMTVTFNPQPYL